MPAEMVLPSADDFECANRLAINYKDNGINNEKIVENSYISKTHPDAFLNNDVDCAAELATNNNDNVVIDEKIVENSYISNWHPDANLNNDNEKDAGTAVGEARSIAVITAEIKYRQHQTVINAIEIGLCLIEAKRQLQHGEFLDWLNNDVNFSGRTARDYIRFATEYSNTNTYSHLKYSSALELLALPKEEREEFVATSHVVNGKEKAVADMSKSELKKLVAEHNALKAEAEKLKQEKETISKELDRLASKPVDIAVAEPSEELKQELLQEGYRKAQNEIAVASHLPKVAFLEEPLGAFKTQLDGIVSTFITAVAYVPTKSGLEILSEGVNSMIIKQRAIMEAYTRLELFIGKQEGANHDVDW